VTLLRPRWIAGHLLVLVLTVSFIAAGFWQLSRNDQKHRKVREMRAAYAAPAPDISASKTAAPGTRVQATGRYDPAYEVLLRNQVQNGKDGVHVLTPMVLADGTAVIVDRGWVAALADRNESKIIAAEGGPVVVRGLARTSSPLSDQDAVTKTGGILSLPRVDLTRIGAGVPYKLQPRWIEVQSQTPAPAQGAPALPQPPAPDQVNHMQYAIQWFSFALIGIIGWPIALVAFSKRRGGFRTGE
jgi:cytochrome oxidase assembly protein ShyY1